jgi:hypothetical protein
MAATFPIVDLFAGLVASAKASRGDHAKSHCRIRAVPLKGKARRGVCPTQFALDSFDAGRCQYFATTGLPQR